MSINASAGKEKNWKGISHSVRFLVPSYTLGRWIKKKEKDKPFEYEIVFFRQSRSMYTYPQ